MKIRLLYGTLILALGVGSTAFLVFFEPKVDYNADVKPILNKHCIACHGGVKQAANVSFLFEEEAIGQKGKSGKIAIVAGDADQSEAIRRILLPADHDEKMPKGGPPLSAQEIETLKKWIDQGAKWGQHWAYNRVESPEVPKIGTFFSRFGLTDNAETSWAKNEIDHFILEKLRVENLKPAPQADRPTLLRRLSLDITGLPPTEAQVAEFESDKSENAYEKQVDKLLNNKAYGERWAGMWLDLARYADTKGYERDAGRTIWRYRDYVIKAFNDDKPFSTFTTEQLAGDLLPNPTNEQLIATAFHRNTMNNDEGGTVDEEFRTSAVIDRVNTTWEVWNGTTFSCVQCHSHPYDPIKHDEYYKFLAFFNNTRDEDVTSDTPTLRLYKPEDEKKVAQLKKWVATHTVNQTNSTQIQAEISKFVQVMEPKYNSHDIETLTNASLLDAKYFGFQHDGLARLKKVTLTGKNRLLIGIGTNGNATMQVRKDKPDGEILLTFVPPKTGSAWKDTVLVLPLPPTVGIHDMYFTNSSPKTPKEWVMIKWVSFQTLPTNAPTAEFAQFENTYRQILNASNTDQTPVLVDAEGNMKRKTQVFERGNWLVKGKTVTANVPHIFPSLPTNLPANRLGLATWMTSRANPLTARVAVNRFWEQFFGNGIVETVEDMGSQGIAPTHRELLDWLAVEFMEIDQWRVKKLLKRIVMSATYQQSSALTAKKLAKDPFNKWLARGPRVRLSAEQVRDQALAVAGLMSHKMFGPSVMPPQPNGIWLSPWNGESWVSSKGEDRYRRALYTYWKRTSPYPSMMTFDTPSREFCQLRRLRTNTPLQALVTLNDTVYVECAERLASEMQTRGKTPEQQISAGFKMILMRDIEPAKLKILVGLYQQTQKYYAQNPQEARKLLARRDASSQKAALTVTANAMLNLDEFVTKE